MTFITDRTKSDVLLGNEKGSYGYTDLNRVEAAVAELSTRLGLSLATKTDWMYSTIPFESEMTRYLGNVAAVRTYCATIGDISAFPELPTNMKHLTHTGANNIEKVLELAYRMTVTVSSELGKFELGKSALGGI